MAAPGASLATVMVFVLLLLVEIDIQFFVRQAHVLTSD